MYFEDFIEACKAYSDLGWSVQEQIDSLLDSGGSGLEYGELNDNAVQMISDWARNLPYDIDAGFLFAAIDEYEALEPEEDLELV